MNIYKSKTFCFLEYIVFSSNTNIILFLFFIYVYITHRLKCVINILFYTKELYFQ